jgi:hypothetical protein
MTNGYIVQVHFQTTGWMDGREAMCCETWLAFSGLADG